MNPDTNKSGIGEPLNSGTLVTDLESDVLLARRCRPASPVMGNDAPARVEQGTFAVRELQGRDLQGTTGSFSSRPILHPLRGETSGPGQSSNGSLRGWSRSVATARNRVVANLREIEERIVANNSVESHEIREPRELPLRTTSARALPTCVPPQTPSAQAEGRLGRNTSQEKSKGAIPERHDPGKRVKIIDLKSNCSDTLSRLLRVAPCLYGQYTAMALLDRALPESKRDGGVDWPGEVGSDVLGRLDGGASVAMAGVGSPAGRGVPGRAD
jgi:hypothetical protein